MWSLIISSMDVLLLILLIFLRLGRRYIANMEEHVHLRELVRLRGLVVCNDIDLVDLLVTELSPGSSQYRYSKKEMSLSIYLLVLHKHNRDRAANW